MPQFEWDAQKDRVNKLKHGITFEQAKTIWEQEILTDEDDRFEYDEQRLKATGLLRNLVCIVVIYTKRRNKIRIISARRASPDERHNYYEESGYSPESE